MNFRKALMLYTIIRPHVDKNDMSQMTILDFASTIVQRMVDRGKFDEIIRSLEILTGKSEDELVSLNPNDIAILFVKSLIENNVPMLIEEFDKFLR